MDHKTEVVSKEHIPFLNFTNNDVLNTDFEREIRDSNLFKAMIVGNTYKQKVKIYFETSEGIKMVETTVWASTEKEILLKDGINLPIRSIKEIQVAA